MAKGLTNQNPRWESLSVSPQIGFNIINIDKSIRGEQRNQLAILYLRRLGMESCVGDYLIYKTKGFPEAAKHPKMPLGGVMNQPNILDDSEQTDVILSRATRRIDIFLAPSPGIDDLFIEKAKSLMFEASMFDYIQCVDLNGLQYKLLYDSYIKEKRPELSELKPSYKIMFNLMEHGVAEFCIVDFTPFIHPNDMYVLEWTKEKLNKAKPVQKPPSPKKENKVKPPSEPNQPSGTRRSQRNKSKRA